MINARSIQFRLIVWYSCLIVVVLLAFAFYTYHGLRQQLYADMEHTLTHRAQQIDANMLVDNFNPTAIASQIHSVYTPEANNRFIRILNPDGSILYVSGVPHDGRFNPNDIALIKGDPPASRIESLSYGNDILITATKAEAGGKTYLVEMGVPTNDIEQTLHNLLMTLLYGLPVIILLVSGGGYRLVNRALQPVENIRFTAEQITFGNLSNRLPVATTGDELEHLSVTLNQMLDRLEVAYDQAKRFSADASHELRTPLTIMRGELEALLHDKGEALNWQEKIGSVLEEIERLSRITTSLFTISRLDAGEVQMEYASCDLAAMAQNIAEQMALLAEVKHIALHVEAVEPVWVHGDSERIKQIIVNLLDNAIKYTTADGNIWLKTAAMQQKAVLEIYDDGIGIPAKALPHVFERFYRTDKARSHEMGGAGLGLAIVHSIVHAHGGDIKIASKEGHGTTVTVELPLIMNTQEQAA